MVPGIRRHSADRISKQTKRSSGTGQRCYNLQKESVTTIPEQLRAFIEQRTSESEYAGKLLNLRVEFERANTASLDIVVIADFDGSVADLYNRLRRTLQSWCVAACNEYGWEIPFTQITLHQAN